MSIFDAEGYGFHGNDPFGEAGARAYQDSLRSHADRTGKVDPTGGEVVPQATDPSSRAERVASVLDNLPLSDDELRHVRRRQAKLRGALDNEGNG